MLCAPLKLKHPIHSLTALALVQTTNFCWAGCILATHLCPGRSLELRGGKEDNVMVCVSSSVSAK